MANQTTTGTAQGPAIFSSFADDPDMKELVDLFVGEMPEKIAQLQVMDSACDLTQLQRLAHQLKGAGGGYGFPTLSTAAAKVEDLIKGLAADANKDEKSLGVVHNDVKRLIELCQRVTNRTPTQ